MKNIFRRSFFLYSPCLINLEGIKDVLCFKFRRLTIGQNNSAVCTNKGGHRDVFSNEWCVSRGRHSMQATEPLSEAKDEVCSLSCSGHG